MLGRTLAILGLLVVSAAAVAQEPSQTPGQSSARTGIVVGKAQKQLTVWTKNGREVFTYTAETIMPQRQLKDGNLVWIRTTAPGSKQAAQIIIIDEQVSVVGRLGREHAAIGHTWEARSPSHLVVRGKDGKEMFVVDPKKFRKPMPEPGQRIAVTYRVENITPPRYIATGLVILPAELERSPVKITYSDIPQPEVVAEAPGPAPAPAPEPEPVVVAALPQTATPAPLVFALGLLLMALGLGVRKLAS